MIAYSHEPQTTIPTSSVKIVGLGGAGVNMLERIALEGLDGAELLALNTDVRKLSHCVANEKIQLGRNLTKGLGSGAIRISVSRRFVRRKTKSAPH
jgi:cell division protein FtsZ